jgi:hypothetical protein
MPDISLLSCFQSWYYDNWRKFRTRSFPHNVFLACSAKHWGVHAKEVEDEVLNLTISFLRDYSILSRAIQAEESIFPQTRIGAFDLHSAAEFGLTQAAEVLILSSGENSVTMISAVNDNGELPLFLAAKNEHVAVTKLLPDSGADPNAKNRMPSSPDGATPFMIAFQQRYWAKMEILLQAAAGVDVKSGCHGSALLVARAFQHEEIVELIRAAYTDSHAVGRRHSMALLAASAGGQEKTKKPLSGKDGCDDEQCGRVEDCTPQQHMKNI